MPETITRQMIEYRLAALIAQRAALDARIEENQTYLKVLDTEAQNAPAPEPVTPSKSRRGKRAA